MIIEFHRFVHHVVIRGDVQGLLLSPRVLLYTGGASLRLADSDFPSPEPRPRPVGDPFIAADCDITFLLVEGVVNDGEPIGEGDL